MHSHRHSLNETLVAGIGRHRPALRGHHPADIPGGSMNADLALLVLRVVVGGIVMQHGLLKLGLVGTGGSVKGVSGWFDGMGLRPGLFWALVTIVAHVPQGFWAGGGKVGWEFPLPLAAAAFAIALLGNGAWSLDSVFGIT